MASCAVGRTCAIGGYAGAPESWAAGAFSRPAGAPIAACAVALIERAPGGAVLSAYHLWGQTTPLAPCQQWRAHFHFQGCDSRLRSRDGVTITFSQAGKIETWSGQHSRWSVKQRLTGHTPNPRSWHAPYQISRCRVA